MDYVEGSSYEPLQRALTVRDQYLTDNMDTVEAYEREMDIATSQRDPKVRADAIDFLMNQKFRQHVQTVAELNQKVTEAEREAKAKGIQLVVLQEDEWPYWRQMINPRHPNNPHYEKPGGKVFDMSPRESRIARKVQRSGLR